MNRRIGLITSDHQRHRWLAAQLAEAGELAAIVSESKPAGSANDSGSAGNRIKKYFEDRAASEAFWFANAPSDMAEFGAEVVMRCNWGEASSIEIFDFLVDRSPDIVILFGSSIIRDPVLSYFINSIINMHLGL